MSNLKPFTTNTKMSDEGVHAVVVDGCKVTLRFNEKSNPAVLNEIKSILSSALSGTKNDDDLQK